MDDPNQQQNTPPLDPQQASSGQSDQDDQTVQDGQDQQADQASGGGYSPEAAPTPVQTETQPQQAESGYEKIKQIEKAAEAGEKKEQAPTPKQSPKPTPKPQPVTPEKKETPQAAKPKYFGYQPPPSFANNTSYIKRKAGTGNPKDSETWLLLFLDRLLKKESEAK